MIDYIIYLALIISILFNIILISKLKKVVAKKPSDSLELTEFIHDLTEGSALIKCTRVDSSNLFLRSPRG